MRILLLTIHYRPEPNFVSADIAEHFASDGHQVVVVTAHPNYPLGRFYETSFPWPRRSVESGVVIWRLPFFPDHSLSKWRRLFSYVSFMLIACFFAPFVCFRPSVVWVYQTPFTTAIASLFFQFFYGSRIAYINADLWPESFSAAGVAPRGPIMTFLYSYSRWINRRADAIVATTRGMLERYQRDGYLGRLAFIPLWVDGSHIMPGTTQARPAIDAPYFIYAGNLGAAQGLETLLYAAKRLSERGIRAKLVIVGSGAKEHDLFKLAQHLNLTNVEFFGRLPIRQVYDLSTNALAQIVHLTASPLWEMTVPSKLAFCFSIGRPVICAAFGETARLANESGGSIVIPPDSPEQLSDAMETLSLKSDEEGHAMGACARHFFAEHFHPDTLLKKYTEILNELAESQPL